MELFIALILLTGTSLSDDSCETFYNKYVKQDFIPVLNSPGSIENHVNFSNTYDVNSSISFNVISEVYQDKVADFTVLCVGFLSASIKTFKKNGYLSHLAATNDIYFEGEIPTGLVNLSTACWEEVRHLGPCSAKFMPMVGVMDSIPFVYPTMSEVFWNNFQDENLFARNWISSMYADCFIGTIPPWALSKLKSLSLSTLRVTGNSWGRNMKQLGRLSNLGKAYLEENAMESLPEDAFVHVPKLTILKLNRNRLVRIEPNYLSGLGNLTNLQLSSNLISSIDPNAFVHVPTLIVLKLDNNRLDQIAHTTLSGLGNLKHLQLSTNFIITIDPNAFVYVPKLINLNLDSNRLHQIKHNSLSGLGNLTDLQLSNNFISSIDSSAFIHVPKLINLYLDNNRLVQIEGNFFSGLDNLLNLQLSFNSITSIEPNAFIHVSKLQTLFLNNNRLVQIKNNSLLGLDNLLYLQLSYNSISSIDPNAFVHVPKLKQLFLNHNRLVQLERNSLSGFNNLLRLVLSNNSISSIGPNAFGNIPKLVYLDMSYNLLTVLKPSLFQNFRSLYLDISNNKLFVVEENASFPFYSENHIDLSYNIFTSVSRLGNAKSVDLSHNSITQFTNEEFSIDKLDLSFNNMRVLHIKGAKNLNLAYNSLSFIPNGMWDSLLNVSYLYLYGNKFDCCIRNISDLKNNLLDRGIIRGKVFCYVRDKLPVPLKKYFYEALCDETEVHLVLAIGIPLGAVCAMLLVLMFVIRHYRFDFASARYVIQMKRKGLRKDDERYTTSMYDAYVCFSHNNYAWVMKHLVPTLENGAEEYRLCVHYRDFTLGASIEMNIAESFDRSRKVIFILTRDFIKSGWCKWELEAARQKMFNEEINFIILIELEKLERTELPFYLRYLMDSHTYLEWAQSGDAMNCWERLRSALGDSLLQRTGKERHQGTVMEAV